MKKDSMRIKTNDPDFGTGELVKMKSEIMRSTDEFQKQMISALDRMIRIMKEEKE